MKQSANYISKIKRIFALACFGIACGCLTEVSQSDGPHRPSSETTAFDQTKWQIKEGKDYPYRDKMLDDVVYNDTIRTLHSHEVINLLGEPDYIRERHLYYRIRETRLGFWTLHTKTMVIKLAADDGIEWIKIHE